MIWKNRNSDAEQLINSLNGQITLIRGNHDKFLTNAKAKAALASEDSVWLSDRKFAVISSNMTATDADAAIKETGLSPILTLPVLE